MAGIKFDITGDNRNVLESFNGVKRGVREMSQTIEQEGISIEKIFERIKTAAALSIAGFSAKEFVQQVATVRGEFQKLEVAFTTMLGSADKANALMNQLVQTAATTPFDLQGVAGGAKQLLAYGVAADEVNDTLIHLGDIAAGLSLPLNDLVYLYGTTMTQGRMFTMDLHQFMGRGIPLADELAKQFGVAKSEVAGLVSAGKVGAEEFKKAIMSMSSEGGKFSGLMEAQSKTISGQISNLEDAVDMMFNEIGKNTQDIISGGIEMAASLVENWKTVGAAILAVVEAVGIYKATLATMAAVNKATTNIGYDAEIVELSKIVPMKEAEANADLQVAVAEGKLTQSKADQIAALRAEAAEELKALTIKETAAKANYQMAVEQHLIAKRNMAVAQGQVKIAIESGTAEEIAAAKRGAATAKQELQTAAIAKNTASKELNTISTQKNAISNGLDAASSTGAATATGVLTAAKLALKRAIDMVNASFLASPIFWIAAAIAGVTFAIYKLVTAESATEAATRKANEAMEEQNKLNEEHRSKVQNLLRTIQDKNQTELAQLSAYNELKTLVPEITDKYSQEALAAAEAAESQKELNAELEKQQYEEAKKKVEEYRKEVERLQAIIGSDDGRAKKPVAAQRINKARVDLPLAEANLKQWEAVERRYEDLQRELAEKSRPLEIRIQEARENVGVMKSISDFYARAKDMTDHWQEANEKINYVTGQTRLEAFIEEAEAELDELRRKQAENPIDEKLRLELTEKQKILNALKDIKEKAESDGSNKVDFYLNAQFKFNWQFLQSQLKKDLAKLTGLTANTIEGDATSLEEEYQAAKERYEKAVERLKEIDANRSKYTKEDRISAQSELSTAKDAYAAVGGDVSSKSKDADKKAENERAQRIKQEARYQELLRKQKIDRERAAKDMELSTTQATIDAMEEGSQKTLAQITLDFQKQSEELRRGYEDLRQKKIDQERQLWEANPANKGKAFDESSVDTEYTEAEENEYNEHLRAAKEEYVRQIKEMSKSEIQSAYDYLTEYGSVQSQKLAIAKEYAAKIAKEEDAWRKKALEKEKQAAIDNLTAENLIANIDLGTVFSDYGKVLAAPLQQTIEQLEAYTKTDAFKQRSITDQKEIFEAIQNAKQQLGSLGSVSFDEIGRNLYEYNNAIIAFNNTSADLEAAAAEVIEAIENEEQAHEALARATTEEDKAKKQLILDSAKERSAQARNKYASAETSYNNAQSKMVESQTAASKSLQTFQNSIENVGKIASAVASGSMKQLWEALGKNTQASIIEFLSGTQSYNRAIDEMTDLLSKKKLGLNDLVNRIKGVAREIYEAGDKIDSAGLGEKISKLFSNLFGDKSKDISKLGDDITKILDKVLTSAKEGGEEADNAIQKAGDEAIKAITQNSGSLWGLIIGLIFDLLDVLSNGIGSLVETILDKVGNAIEGILSEIGSGKFFVNIVNGVGDLLGGVVKGIGNLFTVGLLSSNNEGEMEEIIEEMRISNEALMKSMDNLSSVIKDSTSSNLESVDAYRKALAAEEQWEENQRKAMNARASEWTNTGYGFLGLGGKKSFNHHAPDEDWSGWDVFNRVLREHGYSSTVSSGWNFWNLSPEEMQVLRDFANPQWAEFFQEGNEGHKDPTDLVDEYLSHAGKITDLTSDLNEKLTGYSWSGFMDSYKSLLKNLESTTEDFADHIQELITNALIESFVNDELKADIDALYKFIATAATDGTINAAEKAQIEEMNQLIANKSLTWREGMQAAGMIQPSQDAYEQDVSSGGWQSMGQDTADELNGRFTALQISGEKISEGIASMVATLATLSALADGRNLTLTEIRNLMITNNAYLEDILDANKKAYQKFEQQLDKIVTQTK